jgi:hypothetical protein
MLLFKQATQQTTINPEGASHFNVLYLPTFTWLELNYTYLRLDSHFIEEHVEQEKLVDMLLIKQATQHTTINPEGASHFNVLYLPNLSWL